MRQAPPLLSLTIACSLVCGSVPTLAYAGTLDTTVAPAEDPQLEQAKQLYKDGEIKFQTADYEDALALWKQAFAILPEGEETRTMRHALVYNIAEGHRRAYEVSRNQTHLRKAKILLENYRVEHLQLYGDDPGAVKERAEVDDRIAELDKMIADSEAANEVATPLAEGDGSQQPQPQPQPQQPQPPKPLTPQQQWEAAIKADPTYGPLWIKGGKQVGGGAVLVSIGGLFTLVGAGLVVWGVGLRAAHNANPDPDPLFSFNGTGAMVSGAVFGLAGLGMLIPGAIMIASGSGKRKQVLRDRPRPTAMFVPTLTPRSASFGVALRF